MKPVIYMQVGIGVTEEKCNEKLRGVQQKLCHFIFPATGLRQTGRFNISFLSSSFCNATVKELSKSAYICQSYRKNKHG